jgi:hypothetical protein
VFRSKREPTATRCEIPLTGEEHPMLLGIRIKKTERNYHLNKMARIDFSRIYTVEHDVEAYDIGEVEKTYQERLLSQWVSTPEKTKSLIDIIEDKGDNTNECNEGNEDHEEQDDDVEENDEG